MKRKILLIIASLLCVVGLLIGCLGLFKIDFDFSQLSTQEIQTVTHEVEEDFDSISISTEIADVIFVRSEDETCRVVCRELEKQTHSVTVKNSTLMIEPMDTRKWYDHIGIFFDSLTVTVYLPQIVYFSLSVKTNTGEVEVPDSFLFLDVEIETDTGDVFWEAKNADRLTITTDTGDVSVRSSAISRSLSVTTHTGEVFFDRVQAQTLLVNTDTGDVEIRNTVVSDSISAETATGSVTFVRADAATISVRSNTGDVTGSLITQKIFHVDSGTGDIDVPMSSSGGICEVITETGDIRFEILN